MKLVGRLFLQAKHWQVFVLLIGVAFAGQIVVMGYIPATLSPKDLGKAGTLLFAVVTLLFMLGYLGWIWSMGLFLNSIVPPELQRQPGFFHFALVYPLLYAFVLMQILEILSPAMFAIIIVPHLLAMFCMLYNLYFVSKGLVLAETGSVASFYDYAGPFFLIWFFPVGIWVIQPRINRLYAEKGSAQERGAPT